MSEKERDPQKPVRHILSLSGGKDSTALAIYMRDRVPEMEYVFCDTGEELPETYEYLHRIEAYLGKPIIVLKNNGKGFDEILKSRRNFLPSPQARWCTEYLKIKPYEKYVGEDICINYIGLRADENRKGYISSKSNIVPDYPFIEDGIKHNDVIRILEESGLGLPSYYKWRSRSGCYFCFFQQLIEWVGLLENHPDLFWKAASYEKEDPTTGVYYTWNVRQSLREIANPKRIAEIRKNFMQQQIFKDRRWRSNKPLLDVFDYELRPCLICYL